MNSMLPALDPFVPIDDDHGSGCPARFGMGDCDEMTAIHTIRYQAKRPCFICGRREGDLVVSIWGQIRDICETCYERGTESAREDHEEPEDLNFEGDPTRNGAF